MKRSIVFALAVLASISFSYAAGPPRAVEPPDQKVDTRVHAIFDANGNVAMRFAYPDATGPFNFVWTPDKGWRNLDEAKVDTKFSVVYCKEQLVKDKVPAKCWGVLGGGGVTYGNGYSTGFTSEYQSNFVGPPQYDFIGPPIPTNNTWEGVIGGPGGPVPGGIPPVFDPVAARQSCVNTCYGMWATAVAGCIVLSETGVGAAYCLAAGSGASGCSGNC